MTSNEAESNPTQKAIDGLLLRSIGPAFMGGRIADLAIHPDARSTWFAAVGSGGVWRTTNAGITWTPVFDDQSSYSIGCVRIDPSRPNLIWVGTGEAVSGRHVAWGDGVYRSLDGGDSWQSMGLKASEHISDILIDPRNSDVVFVAAEGPLWSAGGQRGLYRTTDGGASWDRVLEVDDDTGVTSAVFAPDDPDTIYAATYQRRRRVWSFNGGGPGSGIHVSNDGGATWTRISEGLPKADLGRIGLAVTAASPEVVYATIEAAEKEDRGFYRSTNRGRSWERRNEYISGGTGPHYYQELFASPTDPDRVYQVDVFLHRTTDGGATFTQLEDAKTKHADNHVLWIDPDDGDHLIVGCDAGIYESFDEGAQWRHVSNLPVSQFYRVAVDNSVPFTNVLGGAQDLGTISGPTRTTNLDGIRNRDWYAPLGADGYHVAFDPGDPDISYMEWQVGNVYRHNRRTMELTDIQPLAGADDPPERWNWDTPIVVSPHRAERIYLASQRVWRSDDRGNSWNAISGDLTTDQNRYELPTGGSVLSVDSMFDHFAMSLYCTITTFAESAVAEGLLYAGTDDGLIQVSEDGGANWRQTARPPGLSEVAFINAVRPSEHDSDVVFVAADDHKSGDYAPYLFRSDDRGRTWKSVSGDLPERSTVWAIEQDHIEPELLFVGAEHGLHVSLDGGEHWHRLRGGVPTISFRDIAIQRRDNDLIGGTFGRGMYVLDDYSALRHITADSMAQRATLFPVRDAWWYVPYRPMQSVGQPTLGATAYRAKNPDFGATFTYHLSDDIRSAKAARTKAEKDLMKDGTDVPFPGWEALKTEHLETDPLLMVVVRDELGVPIRSLPGATTAGVHRSTWDLRYPAPDPINLEKPSFQPPWVTEPQGVLVEPGDFTAELVLVGADGPEIIAGPEQFSVVPVPAVAQTSPDHDRLRAADLARRVHGSIKQVESARDRLRHIRAGVSETPGVFELVPEVERVHGRVEALAAALTGDPVRERLAEAAPPSIRDLIDRVVQGVRESTGPLTATQHTAVERAESAFALLEPQLRETIEVELPRITAALDAAGGGWTPR